MLGVKEMITKHKLPWSYIEELASSNLYHNKYKKTSKKNLHVDTGA